MEQLNAIQTNLDPIIQDIYSTDSPPQSEIDNYLMEKPFRNTYDKVSLSYVRMLNQDEECRNLFDTRYIAQLTGILETQDPVHFHELGGRDGIFGATLASLRGDKETTITNWEINSKSQEMWNKVKNTFGFSDANFQFNLGDISQTEIKNIPGKNNCWLIRHPQIFTPEVIKKITNLKKEDDPDSIILIPCRCHTYEEYQYPFANQGTESPINQKDWDIMIQAASVKEFRPDPMIRRMKKKAANIIDPLIAYSLNLQENGYNAHVYAFPFESDNNRLNRTSGNLIHIKKIS